MAKTQRPDDEQRSFERSPVGNGQLDHRAMVQPPALGAPPIRGPASSELFSDPTLRGLSSRGFRTVLRNRYFLRLWIAQLISQTIMNASNYGLIVLVAKLSNKVTFTGLAIVAFSLPPALFGAPAGVLVDRFNRRHVLWISNVLRAAASVGFVVSLFIDQRAFVPVLILSFITAMIGQFFAPAEGATIPLLVHPDELVNALALFNITFTLAQALGLIVLGPAIVLFAPTFHVGIARYGFDVQSIETLFLVVAALYVLCALLILSIPPRKFRLRQPGEPKPSRAQRLELRSIWAGIVESWRFMRRDRMLEYAVFQLCLGGTVVAIVATIAPQFVSQFFHKPQAYAALVLGPAGLGLIIGSVFTPMIVRRLRYPRTVSIGVILLSLCTILLTLVRAVAQAVHHTLWWEAWPYLASAFVLIFLVGVALDFINVPAQTRMQEHAPDFIKGRILALQGMLLNAATVPSVIAIGLLADFFDLTTAMDVLAVVIVLAGLGSVYRSLSADPHHHVDRSPRLKPGDSWAAHREPDRRNLP